MTIQKRLERALAYLAPIVAAPDGSGEIYVPIFAKLDAALDEAKAQKDALSKARAIVQRRKAA
jgi:hypothetical protein